MHLITNALYVERVGSLLQHHPAVMSAHQVDSHNKKHHPAPCAAQEGLPIADPPLVLHVLKGQVLVLEQVFAQNAPTEVFLMLAVQAAVAAQQERLI